MKSFLRKLLKEYSNREISVVGKQQFYVLAYYTIATLIGLATNLLGLSGPQMSFNYWLNLVYFITAIAFFIGYKRGIIPVGMAISVAIFFTQIITSIEMIYCALMPDEYHLLLILGNVVLLAVNMLLSIIAYLAYVPYILCVLSMGTYYACVVITKNDSLDNFFMIFFAIFIFVSVLGTQLIKNIKSLNMENVSLKREEQELFNMLGLNKEQVKAYLALAQRKHDVDRIEALLRMLGDDLQMRVVNNVKEYLSKKESMMYDMKKLFPELSASELEVCRLILRDKKLTEICAILDKKESNINSTRAHIRKKLNMQPSDNLRSVLQQRVGGNVN